MNRDETVKIMGMVRALYPTFHANAAKSDLEAVVSAWQMMFDGDSFIQVQAALKAFIALDTKGFPPVIGQIKENLAKLRHGEDGELSENEAWALVQRALRNGIYGYQKEYTQLPETVRRCVGSPILLHEWAQMDVETVNSVVASNFMRSYKARAAHVREMEKLPEDVKALYAAVSNAFRLPDAGPSQKLQEPQEPDILGPGEPIPVPEHFLEIRRRVDEENQKRDVEQVQRQVAQIFANLFGVERADQYLAEKETKQT